MLARPKSTLSLRHIALFIKNFEQSLHFYTEILGMTIEWKPDEDNIYLTFGSDNLALHRATGEFEWPSHQHLAHLGFILKTPDEVDAWYNFLQQHSVIIKAPVRNHRDGARSFYCLDPDNNVIQMIYHPPIADKL